jgi:hypothetical protein
MIVPVQRTRFVSAVLPVGVKVPRLPDRVRVAIRASLQPASEWRDPWHPAGKVQPGSQVITG